MAAERGKVFPWNQNTRKWKRRGQAFTQAWSIKYVRLCIHIVRKVLLSVAPCFSWNGLTRIYVCYSFIYGSAAYEYNLILRVCWRDNNISYILEIGGFGKSKTKQKQKTASMLIFAVCKNHKFASACRPVALTNSSTRWQKKLVEINALWIGIVCSNAQLQRSCERFKLFFQVYIKQSTKYNFGRATSATKTVKIGRRKSFSLSRHFKAFDVLLSLFLWISTSLTANLFERNLHWEAADSIMIFVCAFTLSGSLIRLYVIISMQTLCMPFSTFLCFHSGAADVSTILWNIDFQC